MAVLKNRAGVTTSTTGAGTITLGSALTSAQAPNNASWQTFANAGVANGDAVRYLILDSNGAWEYGQGVYSTAGTTLARAAGSMNGSVAGQKSSTGSLLVLSGTAHVFITALSEDIGGAFVAASTAPTTPKPGDFWYNLDTGVLAIYINDGSSSQWVQVGGGAGVVSIAGPPQGRLTLVNGSPVMTVTAAAKTTILYTPYVGNLVPIYDGTSFAMTPFAEFSVATTDTAKNPAAIGASKVNDWFVWSDAGTLRLTHSVDWTDDTTRASALMRINGLWVNNASITNGPAAQRGTYVGTTRSNASSQLDWILPVSPYGTQGRLAVWNCYNRRLAIADVRDGTNSWTVTSSTPNYWNVNANNSCLFVRGLNEDAITMLATIYAAPTAAVYLMQMSLDGVLLTPYTNTGSAYVGQVQFSWGSIPGIGAHTLALMEACVAGGSVTVFGGTAGAEGQQLYSMWS